MNMTLFVKHMGMFIFGYALLTCIWYANWIKYPFRKANTIYVVTPEKNIYFLTGSDYSVRFKAYDMREPVVLASVYDRWKKSFQLGDPEKPDRLPRIGIDAFNVCYSFDNSYLYLIYQPSRNDRTYPQWIASDGTCRFGDEAIDNFVDKLEQLFPEEK